jgi:DICT domain-containing protein
MTLTTSSGASLPTTGPLADPALLAALTATTRADKRHLFDICRAVESRTAVTAAGPATLVIACLQDARFLTSRTRAMYDRIAAAGCRVLVVGRGLPSDPLPATGSAGRMHTAPLAPDDPLVQEWDLLVTGPDTSFTLVSREDLAAPSADDWSRRFWFRTSRDPAVSSFAARAVLQRVGGAAAPPPATLLSVG